MPGRSRSTVSSSRSSAPSSPSTPPGSPRLSKAASVAAALIAVLPCAPALAQESGKSSDAARDVGRAAPGEDNSYFNVHARIRIPARLLKQLRDGRCAVWYPQRGADRYTAGLPCRPRPAVLPGGILLAPSKDPVILEAAVFHATTPALVVARGAFDARTGLLLRSIDPDRPMDIDAQPAGAGASGNRR